MIQAVHALLYAPDAERARAFHQPVHASPLDLSRTS